ncbi:hypothetical protein B7494_g2629 [Chlorociboria aeruginascens]|nr:hypothetical protein B7494_g2629 [Chlorociboria aeruginascens]
MYSSDPGLTSAVEAPHQKMKSGYPAGPLIIHLIRHAESEHKPRGCITVDHDIRDPKLNEAGRKHCIERAKHLCPQAKYITHILASPLSRTLETACLTFPDVINRGVKVLAIPELQSLSSDPCSIGMDICKLKERYCGPNSVRPRKELNSKCTVHATTVEVETLKVPDGNQAVQEMEDDDHEQGQDTNQRHSLEDDENQFRGMVDLRHMEADWNQKEFGRWSDDHQKWRTKYLKKFLKGLHCATGYKRTEIVIVGHSSSLGNLTGACKFDNHGLDFDTYTFNKWKELERMSADIVAQARTRDDCAERQMEVSLYNKNISDSFAHRIIISGEQEVSTPIILPAQDVNHIERHEPDSLKCQRPMSDDEVLRPRKKARNRSRNSISKTLPMNFESRNLRTLEKDQGTEEQNKSRPAEGPSTLNDQEEKVLDLSATRVFCEEAICPDSAKQYS